jgi:hypothetical protein
MAFKRLISYLSGPNPILMIHIMKTAGTSFRKMLQDDIGCENVFPSDRHLEELPNGWYMFPDKIVATYTSLPKHKVLIGHFPAAIIDQLPRSYSSAVFLRDPLQRSLSLIQFFSNQYNKSIEELIEDQDFIERYIKNYQTKILGMKEVVDPNIQYNIDDEVFKKALERVHGFDFLGITELFEDSCKLFDKLYKTNTLKYLQKTNVSRPEGSELLELKEFIKPLIEKDEVIYRCACERLLKTVR